MRKSLIMCIPPGRFLANHPWSGYPGPWVGCMLAGLICYPDLMIDQGVVTWLVGRQKMEMGAGTSLSGCLCAQL